MAVTQDQQKSPRRRRVPTIVVVIVLSLFIIVGMVLVWINSATIYSWVFPPTASAEAENVNSLFQILLTIGTGIFLLVQLMLVYSIFAFRRKPGDNSEGATFHGNTILEIVWTGIPAIIVIFLSIASYSVWTQNTEPKSDVNMVNGQSIGIDAIGQRFAWSFNYRTNEDYTVTEDPDDTVIFSSPQLRTYVGQVVEIQLATRDVIHSFWIPAMRIKQDLLPGLITSIRFTPIEAGEYPIVCAELCGGGHGEMVSSVIVYENEEEYLASFYDELVFAENNPPDDPVELGQAILSSGEYPCSNCHILSSLEGWVGVTGPSLDGIGTRAARRGESAGGIPAEEYIIQSLRMPNAYVVPGYNSGLMPHFGPTEDAPDGVAPYTYMPSDPDLISIVSYLCTQTDDGVESTCDFEAIPATVEQYDQ